MSLSCRFAITTIKLLKIIHLAGKHFLLKFEILLFGAGKRYLLFTFSLCQSKDFKVRLSQRCKSKSIARGDLVVPGWALFLHVSL